jgi:hypothetical protein
MTLAAHGSLSRTTSQSYGHLAEFHGLATYSHQSTFMHTLQRVEDHCLNQLETNLFRKMAQDGLALLTIKALSISFMQQGLVIFNQSVAAWQIPVSATTTHLQGTCFDHCTTSLRI